LSSLPQSCIEGRICTREIAFVEEKIVLDSTRLYFCCALFIIAAFAASAAASKAADFTNPLLKISNAGCTNGNLRAGRFSADVSLNDRLNFCSSINRVTIKLNSVRWSAGLSIELKNIWQAFSFQTVTLRKMPKGESPRMLAMSEAFPSGVVGKNFEASVYLRSENIYSDAFFQIMLHELRHIYDFYEMWRSKGRMNSIEVERRAFRLMSKISQETPERENFSSLPKFWDDSWAKLPEQEISSRRDRAIEKYLQDNKFYRDLVETNSSLDFTYLKPVARQNQMQSVATNYKKGGERLPNRPALPNTSGMIAQRIQELDFKLDKPRNARDQNEILRVALSNEKKLYYGMSNFVYEEKLRFQCWKQGVPVETFTENTTLARDEKGNVLLRSNSSPSTLKAPTCVSDYGNLKTDFTETFWASPMLDKMPIRFAGFVKMEGKILAQYTVLEPGTRLYNQLARKYSPDKPFRVFVGTIFVCPNDGQIVKFWGTSFPEAKITGNDSREIKGGYSVTAIRQKLNLKNGIWVTVFVGTAAVSTVEVNPFPFSYTVYFNNYRQSTTDVRILENQ
jgi:hypothetical protein